MACVVVLREVEGDGRMFVFLRLVSLTTIDLDEEFSACTSIYSARGRYETALMLSERPIVPMGERMRSGKMGTRTFFRREK